jgi:hypothetical protein
MMQNQQHGGGFGFLIPGGPGIMVLRLPRLGDGARVFLRSWVAKPPGSTTTTTTTGARARSHVVGFPPFLDSQAEIHENVVL